MNQANGLSQRAEEAIGWIFTVLLHERVESRGTAAQLRQRVRERFGADVDAELAGMFAPGNTPEAQEFRDKVFAARTR